MTHGHAHEEAEHASHLAHDPFDRRVAMSMVAIAAVLAAVKVLGHRAHNETLAYQIKAGVSHTQASNAFSFFQAKRQRLELAQLQASQILLLAPLSPDKASPGPPSRLPDPDKAVASFTRDLQDEKVESPAEQARQIVAFGEKRFNELRNRGLTPAQAEQVARLEMTARRYRIEADAINARAKAERDHAAQLQDKSHHKHRQADWFDLGELGVELALVLSSVAILTKRPPYWYSGLALGALGLLAVSVGFFI